MISASAQERKSTSVHRIHVGVRRCTTTSGTGQSHQLETAAKTGQACATPTKCTQLYEGPACYSHRDMAEGSRPQQHPTARIVSWESAFTLPGLTNGALFWFSSVSISRDKTGTSQSIGIYNQHKRKTKPPGTKTKTRTKNANQITQASSHPRPCRIRLVLHPGVHPSPSWDLSPPDLLLKFPNPL